MDPASMAIGAFSLLFQMFSGCIDGYKFISDACRAHSDCYALLVKFKLEENRLINWAKLVKLDYTDDSLTFNQMSRMLVLDVMEQQRNHLNKFRKLEDKKGYRKLALTSRTQTVIQHEPATAAVGNGSTPLAIEDAVQFPPIESEQIVQKAFVFLKRFQASVAEVPKRLQFATIHKDNMADLIDKLASLNDKMLEALGQGQMETLISMHRRTDYQILVMNQKFEQFTQIINSQLSSSRRQKRVTYLEDDSDDLETQIIPRDRRIEPLGALAQTKALHQAIEGSTVIDYDFAESLSLPEPSRASAIRETELSIADIRTKDGGDLDDEEDSSRTEAFYKDTSVWIEWKPAPTTPAQANALDPKIEERVKTLAALLKSNSTSNPDSLQFPAPICLGYFQHAPSSRFALVFQKPPHTSPHPPTTLYALLTQPAPSLTARIALMLTLSSTLERLHAINWLHKGLRSSNMLFFPLPQSQTINFQNPYLSGFDYARPTTRDDLTEQPSLSLAADLYRHPAVQHRSGFRKQHDIYALGLLLLEIALWRPLDDVLGIDVDSASPRDAWRVRERVLGEVEVLDAVRSAVGDRVEGVVRGCLEGGEGWGVEGEGPELQMVFGERVVAVLEGVRGL